MKFPALLAPVLFTTLVFAAPARADEVDLGPPVPQDRLDQLRGGFDLPSGLSVAFGFERLVTLNGQVVLTQTVTIPDISKMTTDQAAQLAAITQGKTVQIGGGTSGTPGLTAPGTNTVAAPTAGTTGTPTNPVVTVPTAPGVPNTPVVNVPNTPVVNVPTSPVVDTATTPSVASTITPNITTAITPDASVALIPNVSTSLIPGMNTLVIQNALDGQAIQAMTTIHAAVNTLSLLHDIHFTQSLGDSLLLGGTP
ncbi:hypothetical protein [Lysobacter claricitrinus]|uniref:hypothetical protein n=1 Tax=Lysobacter claricitrinus TaxID=3367728 RepID=UPI0037DB789B